MSDLQGRAEGLLIAACVSLVVCGRDENLAMWMGCIQDALACMDGCSPVLMPVKASANAFISAAPGRPRDCAFTRLRLEVGRYYQKAAGVRYEALKTTRRRAG